MLSLAKIYKLDYMLVMDSDAWIEEQDWEIFAKSLEKNLKDDHIIYTVHFRHSTDTFRWAYLYKPDGMRYYLLHNYLRHRCGMGTLIPWCPAAKFVPGITINHSDNLRHAHYKEMRKRYREWKKPLESAMRVRLGYPPYRSNEM